MRCPRLFPLVLVACAGDPDAVQVELSPSLISSLDGTTTISAIVVAGAVPLEDEPVHITIDYVDRNGTPHMVAPIDAVTDSRGVVEATIDGLAWDGIGTVTAVTGNAMTGQATFTVLDRTPPKIEILPPTTDLRVGPGLPLDVQVHVTDEIGVSEVYFDGTGGIDTNRRTVVASGSQDTTITFRTDVAVNATTGPSIKLYALASDLSGNWAAAEVVTLTVDPAITIATPPGLSGSLLVDGTQNQLADPRAIAWSQKDSHLYITDVNGNGACNPSCVWRVDPTTGTIDATPVFVGQNNALEGIAVDATSDNLYVSDRQGRIVRLTWSGTAYTSPAECIQQVPQDPYHLVIDSTNGILVPDGQNKNLQRVATCTATSAGAAVSAQDSFDQPRGVALGAGGEMFVSDTGTDRVSTVATDGTVTPYANIDVPYGMEWLATSTTQFANSLLVASMGDRIIASTKGGQSIAATYLRNDPIDLTVMAGTMFIVTAPSANNRGRVYKVTGF